MTTSQSQPLSPDQEIVIRALGRLLQVLPRALDNDLDREQRLTLNEYFALMHLSEAPDRLLRMSELADRCSLSLSGMTRIVSRLEEQGFVKRIKVIEDLRGSNAVLTDLGLARLEQAWPTFLTSAHRYVVDNLEGLPLRKLGLALEACLAAIDATSTNTPAVGSSS